MAGNKAAIKSRIKSINATKKITGAMELIASAKLSKQRNQMFKNREYSSVLKDTVNQILSGDIDSESVFLKKKENPKKVYIVFCSDLGMCCGYNINVSKLAETKISRDDKVFVIGTKQYSYYKRNFNVVNEMLPSDTVKYSDLKKIADEAIEMYKNDEVGQIVCLYTHFVNNVTFNAEEEVIIPCKKEKVEKKSNVETLLEPNAEEILENLIPMMIESEVYAKWLESKVAEQGSRRFAMENATDNAEELTEELLLAYNQARQAAITQEITEIVSGADAL